MHRYTTDQLPKHRYVIPALETSHTPGGSRDASHSDGEGSCVDKTKPLLESLLVASSDVAHLRVDLARGRTNDQATQCTLRNTDVLERTAKKDNTETKTIKKTNTHHVETTHQQGHNTHRHTCDDSTHNTNKTIS